LYGLFLPAIYPTVLILPPFSVVNPGAACPLSPAPFVALFFFFFCSADPLVFPVQVPPVQFSQFKLCPFHGHVCTFFPRFKLFSLFFTPHCGPSQATRASPPRFGAFYYPSALSLNTLCQPCPKMLFFPSFFCPFSMSFCD